jgi:hypothetical protein
LFIVESDIFLDLSLVLAEEDGCCYPPIVVVLIDIKTWLSPSFRAQPLGRVHLLLALGLLRLRRAVGKEREAAPEDEGSKQRAAVLLADFPCYPEAIIELELKGFIRATFDFN